MGGVQFVNTDVVYSSQRVYTSCVVMLDCGNTLKKDGFIALLFTTLRWWWLAGEAGVVLENKAKPPPVPIHLEALGGGDHRGYQLTEKIYISLLTEAKNCTSTWQWGTGQRLLFKGITYLKDGSRGATAHVWEHHLVKEDCKYSNFTSKSLSPPWV